MGYDKGYHPTSITHYNSVKYQLFSFLLYLEYKILSEIDDE